MLVLRVLGLGDLATAVPALRGIRRAFPHRRVVLATAPHLSSLVEEMDFVDAMLDSEELAPLPVQLEGDDVAVNLHGRGPESTLLLLETNPPRLIAFAHPDIPATFGFPVWRRGEHEVRRWCRLLSENGIEARPDELALPLPRRPVGDRAGATVLHPGASSPARQWPPDRWAMVARSLASSGEEVIVTGGPSEVPIAREVAREGKLPSDSVLAGRTDAAELAAVIASAGRLISSDTGPAHLATAYGTPSLTLFGPTSPEEWGPPAGERHMVIWKGRSGPPDSETPHPGLLEITVDEVLAAADRLPRRTVSSGRPPSRRPPDRPPTVPVEPAGRLRPGEPRKDGW